MKENSIEEDIEIVENILHKGYTMSILHPSTNIRESEIKAIEHILSDYKRILKENEKLKNNTRKNENELEFDIDCDWIALQKMLDESEKSNEYISYKNEKWIKEKYCIPIQKIKDKIEELKSKADYCEEQAQAPFSFNFWHREFLKATHKKQALQELLEKEE